MNYGKSGAILPVTGLALTGHLWLVGVGLVLVIGGLLLMRLVNRKRA